MDNSLITARTVLTSDCDAEGKLGVRNIFDWFMDLAAEHAALLGVGYHEMLEHGCIWVAVRTKVKIYHRSEMGRALQAETWPGKPGLAKSDRFYRLSEGGLVLTEGRTEWTAQDVHTGAIRRTDSYGWPDIETRQERVCEEAFTRFKRLAEGELFSYTVGSMDIDTGHHMNNVAYIRMLLGTFSAKELAGMDICGVEVSYRRACLEGEKLTIRRLRSMDCWQFQVEKMDGEAAMQALIRFRGRFVG